MKNLLFVFSLLTVLSPHVLASNEIMPEGNSDKDTSTDTTTTLDSNNEDVPSSTNANEDKKMDYQEDAQKQLDEFEKEILSMK